jgi:hypothetical protein
MELLTPGAGLIFWQVMIGAQLLLLLVSWIMILISSKIDPTKKIIWLSGTLFLPVIGPLVFLLSFRSFSRN